MKPIDLDPSNVDKICERPFNPTIAVLPYRVGHYADFDHTLSINGMKAKDSNGINWIVFEDNKGLYKERCKMQNKTRAMYKKYQVKGLSRKHIMFAVERMFGETNDVGESIVHLTKDYEIRAMRRHHGVQLDWAKPGTFFDPKVEKPKRYAKR